MSGQMGFDITKIGDKEHLDITLGGPEPNQPASSTGQIADGAWDLLPNLGLSKVRQQALQTGRGASGPFYYFY